MSIKNILLIFTLSILVGGIKAQNTLMISRQVICPLNISGEISDGSKHTICIGQPEYSQLTSSTHILHEGFIQVDNQWCPGDYNGSGLIDVGDILLMLPLFGCSEFCDDMNQDGIFNVLDLLIFIALMGSSCNL